MRYKYNGTIIGLLDGYRMGISDNPYDHKQVQEYVKTAGYSYVFSAKEALGSDRELTYVIDTPPPTVSGNLHMGHLLSYSHIDFIARYQRMMGKNVFFPIGYDDNGLPTLKLLEDSIKKNPELSNKKDSEIVSIYHDKFKALFQDLGMSYDWNLQYSTSDCSEIAQLSFIDLHNKGMIISADAPVFWDVVQRTSLAQSDIRDQEVDGEMHHLIFYDDSGNAYYIDSTRPEMIPSCAAVLYHPDDERYANKIPRSLRTPLMRMSVPTIADEDVKITKGTGLVMLCLFGDEQDVIWAQRHKQLLAIKGTGLVGSAGHLVPGYATNYKQHSDISDTDEFDRLAHYGFPEKPMTVSEARKFFISEMTLSKNYRGSEKIRHVVKVSERSGAKVELVSSKQLFCKTLDHQGDILAYSDKISWRPDHAQNQMIQWINSLRYNWCISRARSYGIKINHWRITSGGHAYSVIPKLSNCPVGLLPLRANDVSDYPVWREDGLMLTGSDIISDEEYEIYNTEDRFDTWFTSALTPHINAGALKADKDFIIKNHVFDYLSTEDRVKLFTKLFPADLRPQGHDIIRTWAFYTLNKACAHNNSVPWHNAMISGWCLAHDKTKMSKSKGNALDPVNLLDEFGADALRYWAANAKLGADTAYDDNVTREGRRLASKIWNASRLIQKAVGHEQPGVNVIDGMDLWIIQEFDDLHRRYTALFAKYDYSVALQETENFFWKLFCDNYLECIKGRVYTESDTLESISAKMTMSMVFRGILCLFAPFVPFVTQVVYAELFGDFVHKRGIMLDLQSIQTTLHGRDTTKSVAVAQKILKIIELNRKIRSSLGVSPKKSVKLAVFSDTALEGAALTDLMSCVNSIEHSISSFSNFNSSNENSMSDDSVGISISFVE